MRTGAVKLMLAIGVTAAASAHLSPAQAQPDFSKARERNAAYCRSLGQGKPCIDRQNQEMAYFVKMMVAFDLSEAELKRCMTQGKRGKFIDWTVATPCLRKQVKGRRIGS